MENTSNLKPLNAKTSKAILTVLVSNKVRKDLQRRKWRKHLTF
jgi:hypothetical protein